MIKSQKVCGRHIWRVGSLVLAAGGGVAVGVEVGHLDDGAEGAHGAGALAPRRRAEAALEAALLQWCNSMDNFFRDIPNPIPNHVRGLRND